MKQSLAIIFGVFVILIVLIIIYSANINNNEVVFDKSPYQDPNEKFELYISKISVRAPIIFAKNSEESMFQKNLENGVVHYPDTAMPGQIGNCYIFGHSSDNPNSKGGYKQIFSKIDKLNNGDVITIESINSKYQYRIFDKYIVVSTDLSVLSQSVGERKLLTLQTSYPVGTANSRLIIKAELIENN